MSIVLVGGTVTSKAEQNALEKDIATTAALSGLGKNFEDPYTGMEFVFVKGGCYEMGDTFGDGNKDVSRLLGWGGHYTCLSAFKNILSKEKARTLCDSRPFLISSTR